MGNSKKEISGASSAVSTFVSNARIFDSWRKQKTEDQIVPGICCVCWILNSWWKCKSKVSMLLVHYLSLSYRFINECENNLEKWHKKKQSLSNTHSVNSLSLSAFPFNLWGNYLCGGFSTTFEHFFSRSPRILQQPQSDFEGAHFCMFKQVFFSRVMVHCHLSTPDTGAYSFSKSEMGF